MCFPVTRKIMLWSLSHLWFICVANCSLQFNRPPGLESTTFDGSSFGRLGKDPNISSVIMVISAPVSILKSISLLLILSPIIHGSSYSPLDETAPKKNFSSPLGSSGFFLTSEVFFVRQTAAKCPVLLQMLHCLNLAGQTSVWRSLRLHLPQRLQSCRRSFSFIRQNYFPFI